LYQVFTTYALTGGTLEVSYRTKVFEVTIKPTSKVIKSVHRSHQKSQSVLKVVASECENCGDMTLNDVCMNVKCDSKVGAIRG